MKKLLILSLLLVSMLSYSQKVYDLDKKETKTESVKTLDVAIYKGVKYPVYKSKNNKYYINVTSKKGNVYRKYIQ